MARVIADGRQTNNFVVLMLGHLFAVRMTVGANCSFLYQRSSARHALIGPSRAVWLHCVQVRALEAAEYSFVGVRGQVHLSVLHAMCAVL